VGLENLRRRASREVSTWQALSRERGRRHAVVALAHEHLHLQGVDATSFAALQQRLAAAEAEAAELRQAQQALTAELRQRPPAADTADDPTRHVLAVTSWVEQATVDDGPLLTVVLATRNRSEHVGRAVRSVLAQAYDRWELLVVDDRSEDGTADVLAGLAAQDSRVTVLEGPGRGVGAARNTALRRASGELVTYLDDDNTMAPLWLKAVAWASRTWPSTRVIYGARVMEDSRELDPAAPAHPVLQFRAFDRRALEEDNYIDLGVLAHRPGDADFDEHLQACGDWDLVLRLTEDAEPLALPVVAGLYATSSPHRISAAGFAVTDNRRVRERARARRPLRVLGYNALFPLVTETYIADEMHALVQTGAELAWCTDRWSVSPVTVREPSWTDLDTAVRELDPDLLFLYWSFFADQKLDELSRVGRPFAVRIHSFDVVPDIVRRIQAHPLCVGVWAYPHHAAALTGVRSLVPLVTCLDELPEPAAERPVVLSVSAGLPKKDWPTLVAAFSALAREGVDCRIIIGITDEHEHEPSAVRALLQEAGAPVKLSVDVPHDQVLQLLSRTSAAVYTLEQGRPFGMPRSVIEALCAGSSVILPERPEARAVAGPGCRGYRTADDIVRHVREVLAGGPAVRQEQLANREFGLATYASKDLAERFSSELREALHDWRRRLPAGQRH
jgi:glycosyltransferase involved in cell wall biosynthesis